MPVAHGLGLGFDPPSSPKRSGPLANTTASRPGWCSAITAYVWASGLVLFAETQFHITDDGAEVLTGSPSWQDGTTD